MDQNFHLIEKYFQGKLDKDELQFFNEKLQQDPSFEQEFRDMKLIRDAVKETSRIRALDILQNAEANLTNQETTKINVSMKRLVSIAASLLIVATVSYFAFSGGTGALTGEEIVANYYEPYINLNSTERSGDIEIVTLSARAYNAYDIKDYSTSANLFENLLASEKSAMNYLYSGIANFEAGNLDVAKNNLNTVMNSFTELREQAQWYLALTLFKDGAEEEAIGNLALLSASKSNSSFAKDAKSVLIDMELTLSDSGGTGEIETYEQIPDTETDSPNGTEEIGLRKSQFGTVLSDDGFLFKYFNDFAIDGLNVGDRVEFIVIKTKSKKTLAVIMAKTD
ncbi:MAG: hypothetical protein HEP71_23125 [Roseivirga sp.]|nr:hypothetical protein [Roseivirga sp.]